MQNALGTHACLHHRNRRPGTSSEARISGRREPVLRAQIKGRLLLSDAEKGTLAEIAHRLGRKALEELSAVAKPDTLLAWYRKLIANRFDGSKFRKSQGRPRVDEEPERLVVRMAKENPGWGYDRIVGAMANLGLQLSDEAHCGARCATTKPTIIRKEITKAKTTYCYSLCRLKQSVENRKRCVSGAAGRPAEIL
jgi:hypothetical protein